MVFIMSATIACALICERLLRASRNVAAVQRRQELYLALARCSTGMTKRSSISDLFEAICEALDSVPQIKLVFVGASLGDHSIHPVAARGDGVGYLDGLVLSKDPQRTEGKGAIGRSIRSGKPVWVNDFLKDSITRPWRSAARSIGFRGSACLPIFQHGEVRCVISIYTDTVGYFDTDTRPLLHEFAVQLGLALEARSAEENAAASAQAARIASTEATIANERLGAIIRASSDLICSMDRNGLILTVSDRGRKPLARSREGLIGSNCLDLLEPDGRSYRIMRDALQMTHETERCEALILTFIGQFGQQIPISLSMVWSPEEQVFHCIARDLTEFKALEDAARQAQRLDSIGVLTGGIAHDFNNMLAVIVGNSEFLADNLESPLHKELAGFILQTAERGAKLTEQLLGFARRQPLDAQACDLRVVVETARPLLQHALAPLSRLDVRIADNLPPVVLDANQLTQVLMNMCINARDAMPKGGLVRITLDLVAANRRVLSRRTRDVPDTSVAICVTDTGEGIAPDIIDRIFEPFFTTKGPGKGSGLGLSMAYGFVTQSGGILDVTSRLHQGTTFSLIFPPAAKPAQIAEVAKPADQTQPPFHPGRVLLVEDNELLRKTTRRILEELGCTVIATTKAETALEFFENGESFDLVLTDVALPDGMDGWGLGSHVRDLGKDIPVLYMTGFSEAAPPPELGKMQILRKPFTRQQLMAAISATQRRLPA